jgi:hypothetical protein
MVDLREHIMDYVAGGVDVCFNIRKAIEEGLHRRRVIKDTRRNKGNMEVFLENITFVNLNLPNRLISHYDNDPQIGFTQRTSGEGAYDPFVQMYFLRFRVQTVFGPNSDNVFTRDSHFYFYPQDFLTTYKDLIKRKSAAVGGNGFMVTRERFSCPDLKSVYTGRIQRGIIGGRLALWWYKFDTRVRECSLQIRPDENNLPALNLEDPFSYDTVVSYINKHKHPEKYVFKF